MSAMITAAVGSAVVGGVMANKAASKSAKASREATNSQIALMRENRERFDKLIEGYSAEEQEMLDRVSATYIDLNMLLDKAEQERDETAKALLSEQLALVDNHFSAEMAAIGANADELRAVIDQASNTVVELVRADADANEKLQEIYKVEADKAVDNLSRMASASTARLDSIIETGMTPEAAANLSRFKQGAADISRKAKALEAKVGKGGSASRLTAVDLEALKAEGEVIAQSRREARQELDQIGGDQDRLLRAAGVRMAGLERTRGREELAARSPFIQAEVAATEQQGDRELATLGNKNVETRRLTGEFGAAGLASQQEFARDRMSLVSGEQSAVQAIDERTQDLTSAATAGAAAQGKSMADILGVQAANFANRAEESRKQAGALFGQAAQIGFKSLATYIKNRPTPTTSNNPVPVAQYYDNIAPGSGGNAPGVYGPFQN